eukprot:TRINITY_DN1278_c0_g1_i2.p1 TRINITY_DN1278_c0_g1~~TRINITY_DN1278_c0_g1_i2.p1  ORF type:complete len:509 (-),score=104.22 TRINITY_DN1278_c0_g1_i2:167-1693(-)
MMRAKDQTSLDDSVDDEQFTLDEAIDSIGFGKFQILLLIVSGSCWAADAMETMLLGFISASAACEFNLDKYQEAAISTVVFVGMLVGAYCWGVVSDRYGRRIGYLATSALTFVFGLASAFAPNYWFLLFTRMMVGFGLGGGHVAFTLFAEFLPSNRRAFFMIAIELFWAAGSLFEALLAWLVLPTLKWRWLLGLSAIPMLLLLCFWPVLPESIRYLLLSGNPDKAMNVLNQISARNKKTLPPGKLKMVQETSRGNPKDLISPSLRRTTLLLWFIWFANAFCYYGIVLLVPQIFAEEGVDRRCGKGGTVVTEPNQMEDVCQRTMNHDYLDIVITTAAELPGILLTAAIIDRLGRKKTQALDFCVAGVCSFLLFVCASRTVETIFLFVIRAAITGAFQAVYVYTPEVYPTSIRSTAMGVCSALSRIGAMLAPFVAQVITKSSVNLALGIFGGIAFCASAACMLMPVETAGKYLPSTLKEVPSIITQKRDSKDAVTSPLIHRNATETDLNA